MIRASKAGDCSSPVPPAAGRSALHPFCDDGNCLCDLVSVCNLGNKESTHTASKPTGVLKTMKKAGRESMLSLQLFLVFPGCKSIRPAVFHTAQPVGRQRRSQLAKTHSSFAKGFLRGASGTSNSQKCNLSLQECVRVSLFHRDIVCKIHIAISATGSRGNAPGAGVRGAHSPPAPVSSGQDMAGGQIQPVPFFPGQKHLFRIHNFFQPLFAGGAGHHLHACRMAQDPGGGDGGF